MLEPQHISIFLNNALKPDDHLAKLDAGTALPESIRDMPDQVSGQLVDLAPETAHNIETAWKKIMILNTTRVLYTFTFDSQTGTFQARKR